MKRSWIETLSESLGLIPKISHRPDWSEETKLEGPKELYKYPHPDEWHDFKELDPQAWPEKKKRHYSIVPTTCFNCEAACGMLAYIDKESNKIQKFEGNPHHPAVGAEIVQRGPQRLIKLMIRREYYIHLKEKVSEEQVNGSELLGIKL